MSDSRTTDLPLSWRWMTVGDLTLECRRGKPPAYEGGTTLVVNQKCVRRGTTVDLRHAKKTNEALRPLAEWAVLAEGDILINSTGTGTLGRVGWLRQVAERITVDTHVTLVRPDPSLVLGEYLGWLLHSEEPVLVSAATGSTNQKELGREAVKALQVPVPPLATQRMLVDQISVLWSNIGDAEQRLAEGARLADVLLARHLEGLLCLQGGALPDGWERRKLPDVARLSAGGTPARSRADYFGEGHAWVKIGDLTEGPVTDTEEQITEAGLANSSCELLPSGTVMLAMYGASIGRTGVLAREAATNQAICAMQVNANLISADYLLLLLQASKPAFVAAGYGGAQPNISQKYLRLYEIPVPPRWQQDEILARANDVGAAVRELLAATSSAQSRSKGLRKSLLYAALRGKLRAPSDDLTENADRERDQG